MKLKRIFLRIGFIICLLIMGISFVILCKTGFKIYKEKDFYKSDYFINNYVNNKLESMVDYYKLKSYINEYDEKTVEFSIYNSETNEKEEFSLANIKNKYPEIYNNIFVDRLNSNYYRRNDLYKEYIEISKNEFLDIINKYTEKNCKEYESKSQMDNKKYNKIDYYEEYDDIYTGWIDYDLDDNDMIYKKGNKEFVYSHNSETYYLNYNGNIYNYNTLDNNTIYIPKSYIDFSSEESKEQSILTSPSFLSLNDIIYSIYSDYLDNLDSVNNIDNIFRSHNYNFLFTIHDNNTNDYYSNSNDNLFQESSNYKASTRYYSSDYDQKKDMLNNKSKEIINKINSNVDIALAVYENNDGPLYDNELQSAKNIYKLALYNKVTISALVISTIISLIISIYLIIKNIKSKSSFLIDKIPGELLLIVPIISIFLLSNKLNIYHKEVIFFSILIIAYINFEILLSVFRRISTKTIFSNLLIIMILKKTRSVMLKTYKKNKYSRKKILKLLLYGAINVLITIICMLFFVGTDGNFLVLLLSLILVVAFNIFSINKYLVNLNGMEKIIDVSKEIASGSLDSKIDIETLSIDEQELGAVINSIGDGLKKAVDKSVKDERLKAELITNVSHDIKTPLTSIINYIELIKREPIDNNKIKEYLMVLDNKSQRLKYLTEDLIEASKVSTGNIELEKVKVNVNELFKQAVAEFYDKFNEKSLNVVLNIPKESLFIYADGRRTFRVLENLLQNIYKYSLECSRVYLDLTKEDKNITMQFKNISKEQLNISEEELTERFVRGDESRNTEGSGLGLSIAKNLVTLQEGEFNLCIDGDLFKVIIKFKEYSE